VAKCEHAPILVVMHKPTNFVEADPITILRQPDGAYRLETWQWLPLGLEEVFAFFADARNLEAITPPWLHFQIQDADSLKIEAGSLIDYRLRLHGFPIRWRTRIRDWEPPRRFIDEQLRGPYRLWVHEHRFEAQNGGTRMEDTVTYRVPGGGFVHWLAVERDLRKIFGYRRMKVQALLGKNAG